MVGKWIRLAGMKINPVQKFWAETNAFLRSNGADTFASAPTALGLRDARCTVPTRLAQGLIDSVLVESSDLHAVQANEQ